MDYFKFTGKSQITAYNGTVISSAPADKISAEFVDIDINLAKNKSLNELNNLFDDKMSLGFIHKIFFNLAKVLNLRKVN